MVTANPTRKIKGIRARSDLRAPDVVHMILENSARYPLLSPAEEVELSRDVQALINAEASHWRLYSPEIAVRKAHQKALLVGQRSKDKMITSNQRLVVHYVKKYLDKGAPFEDLFQEGCIGLRRATERFDPAKGYKFSTYATQWILQSITRYLSEKTRIIRYPVHKVDRVRQVCRFISTYERERLNKPSLEEIADFMKLPCECVVELLNLPSAISLDILVSFKDDAKPLSEVVPCFGEQPEDYVQRSQLRDRLEDVFSELTPKEQKVLRLRFGIGQPKPMTLTQIGEEFNASRERIRQIELKAMAKLRKSCKAQNFCDFFAA